MLAWHPDILVSNLLQHQKVVPVIYIVFFYSYFYIRKIAVAKKSIKYLMSKELSLCFKNRTAELEQQLYFYLFAYFCSLTLCSHVAIENFSSKGNSVEIYFHFFYSLTHNCDVFWTMKKTQTSPYPKEGSVFLSIPFQLMRKCNCDSTESI